jgi:hypothetical protein
MKKKNILLLIVIVVVIVTLYYSYTGKPGSDGIRQGDQHRARRQRSLHEDVSGVTVR